MPHDWLQVPLAPLLQGSHLETRPYSGPRHSASILTAEQLPGTPGGTISPVWHKEPHRNPGTEGWEEPRHDSQIFGGIKPNPRHQGRVAFPSCPSSPSHFHIAL